MTILIRFGRGSSAALVGLGLLLAAGCSDDGLPKRYSVSGEVTYNGSPVPNGVVNFVPQDTQGRAASGPIENGHYSLTTLIPKDGAIPGAYRVMIIAMEDTEESKAFRKKTVDAVGPGGRDINYIGPPSGLNVAKANAKAKRLIPDKFSTTETSGLTAEVQNKSNRIDFHLQD